MARYIDADKMIYEIRHNLWDWSCIDDIRTSLVLKQTITDIENQPSEDVAPVVHAYWRCDFKTSEWHCTSCDGIALRMQGYPATALSEYCPHCGAKMLFDEGFDQNEDEG